jgi:hypothetical protein
MLAAQSAPVRCNNKTAGKQSNQCVRGVPVTRAQSDIKIHSTVSN